MPAHAPVPAVTLCSMPRIPEPDRKSPVAPYLQVVEQLIDAIRRGEYGPDEPLPSITRLQQETGIADRTARKVLRTLAERGYAQLSPGMGYYVPRELPDE
jgi:DNA-binding transcriptional regulator YhcF (GntR family)